MTEHVKEISDAEFESLVLEAQKPVLVDFWAPWCAPCKTIGPVIEKIASEYVGDIDFCKLNIDTHKQMAAHLGIRSIPYLIIFKNGEIFKEMVGLQDPYAIVDALEASLD